MLPGPPCPCLPHEEIEVEVEVEVHVRVATYDIDQALLAVSTYPCRFTVVAIRSSAASREQWACVRLNISVGGARVCVYDGYVLCP